MVFNIGDKIVYPSQGVGVIERITVQPFAGKDIRFYQLRLQETNSTVLIPVDNVSHIGLRQISNRQDVLDLLHLLQIAHPEINEKCKDWKNRFKENTEKMKTGRLADMGEVLMVLTRVNSRKSLSFREKKMFDRAKKLLVSEIALVEETPEEAVEQAINQALLQSIGCQLSGTA
jgi:CarD family transcriptional regulator